MKTLITGVAGFVGSNLAKKVLEGGHTVVGIDNLSYGCMRNLDDIINHPNFTFIKDDVAHILEMKGLESDVTVHLASQKIPRYTSALRTIDENYEMLRKVVQKCLRDKSKIVFSSTSDVYGKNPNIPYHEESDLVLGPTTIKRWAYASSKIVGEQFIMANHDEYGLDYTIMRFFGSYGPNQNTTWWGGPQSVFIQNILEGKSVEIHGDGSQTRTFTFIDDLVQGIVKCMFEPNSVNNIYNIASNPDEEITIKELGNIIYRLMKPDVKNPDITFIPYANFGKYEDVMRRVPDITKIKTELGYEPHYTLKTGLKKTIEWQKSLFEKTVVISL